MSKAETQFVMDPCPFCAGPPCISIKVGVDLGDIAFWDSHVWCHDCGATGPSFDEQEIEEVKDKIAAQTKAIELWNKRGFTALGCYELKNCTVVFNEAGDAVQLDRLSRDLK